MRLRGFFIAFGIIAFGCGCTTNPTLISSLQTPSFRPETFVSKHVPLKALYRHDGLSASEPLWVVIEGDGHAWKNASTPSLNPTPHDPIGWKIATQIHAQNILYLARPCQYLDDEECKDCRLGDWTEGRFAPKWVEAMNEAIDAFKMRGGDREIILAGYSGGGTMAALIAARRSDVSMLIGIASPLDIHAWSSYHRVSPLTQSLNPKNEQAKLSLIPQIYVTGKNDTVVPPFLIRDFAASYDNPSFVRIIEVEADHTMRLPLDLAAIRTSFLNSIDARGNPL